MSLAHHFPWDRCVKIFIGHFPDSGRTAIDPRIVIGSLIINHKLCLSDEETARIIEENPYIQYFLGIEEFVPAPLFSLTLFVEWRKKFGSETFNEFSEVLFKISFGDNIVGEGEKHIGNEGKLKLDATVADQNITYPNDLVMLNKAREKTKKIIDLLFDKARDQKKIKPWTYRKNCLEKILGRIQERADEQKDLAQRHPL